jgi:RIO kinase 2
LATAYEAGYVHADMSEYNVAVSSEGITVFDWPQAVPTDHDNARELLARDVRNVVGFFRRKYPGAVPEVDAASVTDRIARGVFESVRTDA